MFARDKLLGHISSIFCANNSDPHTFSRYNVAWLVAGHLSRPFLCLDHLRDSLKMRVTQIAHWMNAYTEDMFNEIYNHDKRYDAVVFFKAMGRLEQEEARKIKAYGGKVIFDANVNYYEIWGKFDTFSNQPTLEQKKDAIQMTSLADLCVGDSSKLCGTVKKHNQNIRWIPDNVNLDVFRFVRKHAPTQPVRLVWSGISFKADHLLLLEDVFSKLKNIELIIVSDRTPQVIKKLAPIVKCRFVPFSDRGYARLLSQCDIIISPKQIVNSYEVGHTEYKITLGMAAGLPAVASPQQSYIEAISYKDGGIICATPEEWVTALDSLIKDHKLREDLGRRARQTVIERYATPVVAKKYYRVIKQCLAR